jgi:RHS repeat-associated protein
MTSAGTYADGKPRYGRTTTDHDQYDGFGHYRRTITSGNTYAATFDGGGDMRVVRRDYNSDVVYTFDSVSKYPDGWLLQRYDSETVQELPNGAVWPVASPPAGLKTRKTEYFFNRANGLLEKTRTFASDDGQRRANDLVTVISRTANGGASRTRLVERFYGGDDANVGLGPLETLSFTGNPDYEVETRLAWGAVQWKGYLSCGGGSELTLEDNTIDPYSGLATQSNDGSGAVTALEYDRMGRITRVTPPGQEPLKYTYYARGSGQESDWARVTLQRGTVTPEEKTWRYDHLGRLAVALSWIGGPAPGDGAATAEYQTYQKTTYDVLGRKSRVWAPRRITDAQAPGFVLHAYDAFGRPTAVTEYQTMPSEVAERTTTFAYTGAWKVVETQQGQGPRVTYADRHGRTIRVDEASGAQQGVKGVRYQYDITSEIASVHDAPNRSPVAAARLRFIRDGRGFVTRENLPELAGLGEGITYSGYDARGHARRRELAQQGGIAPLLYEYDRAERLVKVSNAAGPLKAFTYNKTGGTHADGYKLGKLASTTRWNLAFDPAASQTRCSYAVTETYEYDGSSDATRVQGNVRRVVLNGSADVLPRPEAPCTIDSFGAVTEYQYDQFGNTTNIRYPSSGSSIDYTFRRQYTQTVSGWVTGFRYDPTGHVARIARTNWTRDAIAYEDSGFGRPKTIRLEKLNRVTGDAAHTLWKHGPIVYDGGGNITSVGALNGAADSYLYDPIGRLQTASVAGATETYTYDRWGNLTDITTTIPGQPAVSRSNNINIDTNRHTTYAYDHAGNVVEMPDRRPGVGSAKLRLDYDPFNMLVHLRSTTATLGKGLGRVHLYDANDERVAVIDYYAQTDRERWMVRSTGGQVLSELARMPGAPLTRHREYVYGQGRLLGEIDAAGRKRHLHLDHLGTIAQVTNAPPPNADGAVIEQRRYLPFGYEIAPSSPPASGLRFAGHERDDDGSADQTADFDYMHARFYRAYEGRFLSLDPGRTARPQLPQTWNRYAYVLNNPLKLVDPDGRKDQPFNAATDKPVTMRKGTETPTVLRNGMRNAFAYNCHSFAWHDKKGDRTDPRNKQFGAPPRWDNFPDDDLGGYRQLSADEPNQPGDRVVYYVDSNGDGQYSSDDKVNYPGVKEPQNSGVHSAIVTKVDAEGNTIEVEAKSGAGPIADNHPRAPGYYDLGPDKRTPTSRAYFRREDQN